jgi:hypothetical protein
LAERRPAPLGREPATPDIASQPPSDLNGRQDGWQKYGNREADEADEAFRRQFPGPEADPRSSQ